MALIGTLIAATRRLAQVVGVLLLLTSVPAVAAVDTFVPTDESFVVETLRSRPLERTDVEFRKLRMVLRQRPRDVSIALAVAERAIELSRRDGDPRYLGYAEAALAPWWSSPAPPQAVRLARSIILQSVHRFDDALRDLDLVLAEAPTSGQAWLTRASILQVQGRYDEAADSCLRLGALGADVPSRACLAELRSLSVRIAPVAAEANPRQRAIDSRTELQRIARIDGRPDAAVDGWLRLMLAEIAERLGDAPAAERAFQQALAASADAYARGAYADFLLDHGRNDEVIELLRGQERIDALLLRLAIAQAALGRPEAARSREMLAARFAAAHLRGDTVHLREEARFELRLRGRAEQALALAQRNWAIQKEPADARLLADAAQAAGRPQAAEPVRRFMREHGTFDVRLVAALR